MPLYPAMQAPGAHRYDRGGRGLPQGRTDLQSRRSDGFRGAASGRSLSPHSKDEFDSQAGGLPEYSRFWFGALAKGIDRISRAYRYAAVLSGFQNSAKTKKLTRPSRISIRSSSLAVAAASTQFVSRHMVCEMGTKRIRETVPASFLFHRRVSAETRTTPSLGRGSALPARGSAGN